MTLSLLLTSALRSCVLGVIVWAILKALRTRDSGTETIIWTSVLVASLLMPLMVRSVPAAVHLPLLWPRVHTAAQPIIMVAFMSNGRIVEPTPWHGLAWLQQHWKLLLWSAYAVVAAAGAARLALGLISTVRLYRCSTPVRAPWADGRRVRASNRIKGPVCCGSAIILPADYDAWPPRKLAAVLAHEQSHLDRGDFFIQLLAALHRILFWFNPFSWWLQTRLAFLAEAASDEAAIRLLNDRIYYAEVLLEMSQRSRTAPLLVAMTRRKGVQRRIVQILDEARADGSAGNGMRVLLAAAVLPMAGLLAGARAEVPRASSPVPRMALRLQIPLAPAPAIAAAATQSVGQLDSKPARLPKALPTEAPKTAEDPAVVVPAPPAPDPDAVTYNPRALLQTSTAAVVSTIIPVTPDDRQKASRSTPALLDLRPGNHNSE